MPKARTLMNLRSRNQTQLINRNLTTLGTFANNNSFMNPGFEESSKTL